MIFTEGFFDYVVEEQRFMRYAQWPQLLAPTELLDPGLERFKHADPLLAGGHGQRDSAFHRTAEPAAR